MWEGKPKGYMMEGYVIQYLTGDMGPKICGHFMWLARNAEGTLGCVQGRRICVLQEKIMIIQESRMESVTLLVFPILWRRAPEAPSSGCILPPV